MKLSRPAYWNERNLISYLLYPVSLLFRLLSFLRAQAYRSGLLKSWRSPVPVIIVGNITAGGAGKSPLVIALVDKLRKKNLQVGVVARGYGGDSTNRPVVVFPDSSPTEVGDESVMIANRTGVPVVVCTDRVMAVKHLLSEDAVDIVLCDDGLQHYALQRQLEIVVVDTSYGFGNGYLMPAGPLREPVSRLKSADMIVYSGAGEQQLGYSLRGEDAVSANDPAQRKSLASFRAQPVHALAGIAAPIRFFEFLRAQGLQVIEHPQSDHAVYSPDDLSFDDGFPVLMTEKDWVKVRQHDVKNCWYVPVDAHLDKQLIEEFFMHIDGLADDPDN